MAPFQVALVAPKATGQDRRQKTDRRDSAELLDCLDQYLRGRKTAFNPVAVPKDFGTEFDGAAKPHPFSLWRKPTERKAAIFD